MDNKQLQDGLQALARATTTDERAIILENVTPILAPTVKSSDLVGILAQVMRERKKQWSTTPPSWILKMVDTIYYYMQWDIPKLQTQSLVEIVNEYLETNETKYSILLLHAIVSPIGNKQLVLQTRVYDNMKRSIQMRTHRINALRCLIAAALYSTEWQLKILEDKQFVYDLLSNLDDDVWGLLALVAQHPDAKVTFPSEVVEKAKASKYSLCFDLCAMLCSEADVASLKLSSTYLEERVKILEQLLAVQNEVGKFFNISLLSLVFPFVNLSIADANKDCIGLKLVSPLLKVLAIQKDKPLISKIGQCLERSQQEAAKILWNLAFLEENQVRISQNGGLDFLTTICDKTSDDILKRNIKGILFMYSRNDPHPVHVQETTSKKHVMISYSWFHQRTIFRLANSLKENGYLVWLDVEQMGGSTLEAMAGAIEGAEAVLMCISQKYKDSPNCRLEGEYCVNRKVNYIPLMMQNDYTPDGWLGIALGTKLYFDFSSEENWDAKISGLIKALGQGGKRNALTKSGILQKSSLDIKRDIENWTDKDILSWMQTTGIAKHYNAFISHEIRGSALLELKEQLQTPNHNVLSFLRDGLNTSKMGDVLAIAAAIRKL